MSVLRALMHKIFVVLACVSRATLCGSFFSVVLYLHRSSLIWLYLFSDLKKDISILSSVFPYRTPRICEFLLISTWFLSEGNEVSANYPHWHVFLSACLLFQHLCQFPDVF